MVNILSKYNMPTTYIFLRNENKDIFPFVIRMFPLSPTIKDKGNIR